MTLIEQLARKIRLSLGLGLVKLIDDTIGLQQLQLSLLSGEARDGVNRYQPYGLSAHPKKGADAIAAAVGGNRNHVIVLCVDDPRYRKRELAEGEVALYHWEGDYILLKNGREIEIVSGNRWTVTAPDVVVNAATQVQLNTPLCALSGDLTVDGTITGGTIVTAAGIDLDTHIHSGVQAGPSNTGPPA